VTTYHPPWGGKGSRIYPYKFIGEGEIEVEEGREELEEGSSDAEEGSSAEVEEGREKVEEGRDDVEGEADIEVGTGKFLGASMYSNSSKGCSLGT
jgi:hypothetical protein